MAIYKDTSPTSDGRCWYYACYKKDNLGNNKLHKSKKYKTKSEALEAERLFLMIRYNPIHKPFILVADAYFNHVEQTKRTSTYISYLGVYNKNIKPFFEKYNIDDINVVMLNNWKQETQKKGFAKNYLNKLYNILNSIFQFACSNYGITYNPVQLSGKFEVADDAVKKDSDKLRYITLEDFNKFLSVIDDITWRTFFITLFYTGMRKAEIQALKITDIDFDNNEIIVDKTLSQSYNGYKITKTKNSINRKIKMSATLRKQLEEYVDHIKSYTDYSNKWFLFGCSRYMPRTTIDRYKNYYFKLYNSTHEDKIKEISIHEFRHSHVSLLINEFVKSSKEKHIKVDSGKFFIMMSSRLGHTVETMQRVYMHLLPSIQDEIVDLLDNL